MFLKSNGVLFLTSGLVSDFAAFGGTVNPKSGFFYGDSGDSYSMETEIGYFCVFYDTFFYKMLLPKGLGSSSTLEHELLPSRKSLEKLLNYSRAVSLGLFEFYIAFGF